GWDGDPDEFVNALISAGFIDRVDDRLFLHDWEDYTARYYEYRDLRLLSSKSGTLGNHERWHVRRGVTDPSCPYCNPQTDIASPGASGGDSGATSGAISGATRSEEHTSELQSRENLVCRLLLEKKKIHN